MERRKTYGWADNGMGGGGVSVGVCGGGSACVQPGNEDEIEKIGGELKVCGLFWVRVVVACQVCEVHRCFRAFEGHVHVD